MGHQSLSASAAAIAGRETTVAEALLKTLVSKGVKGVKESRKRT